MALLTVAEAESLIASVRLPTARTVESVPPSQAMGKRLRQDLRADRDYPPFDRVCMDGYAFRSDAGVPIEQARPVEAMVRAGDAPPAVVSPSACLEIMTGAALPPGCDTVIPYEDTEKEGDRILFRKVLEAGQNVHARGRDYRQGDVVLSAGAWLGPAEAMLLASLGLDSVKVGSRLRGLFLATGDELAQPGVMPEPQQVRASNGAGVAALLSPWADMIQVQVVDDPLGIAAALEPGLTGSGTDAIDFILTSGGVSAGKFDWLPRVFAELGVREIFHKVAQRPGKPLWFGQGKSGQPVFGLPGNPVAALVCTRRYVLPWLRREAEGVWPQTRRARLAAPARSLPRLTWFQPVRVSEGEDGLLALEPVAVTGSGDFAGLAGTQGCAEIAAGRDVGDGRLVPYFGWDGR